MFCVLGVLGVFGVAGVTRPDGDLANGDCVTTIDGGLDLVILSWLPLTLPATLRLNCFDGESLSSSCDSLDSLRSLSFSTALVIVLPVLFMFILVCKIWANAAESPRDRDDTWDNRDVLIEFDVCDNPELVLPRSCGVWARKWLPTCKCIWLSLSFSFELKYSISACNSSPIPDISFSFSFWTVSFAKFTESSLDIILASILCTLTGDNCVNVCDAPPNSWTYILLINLFIPLINIFDSFNWLFKYLFVNLFCLYSSSVNTSNIILT